MRWQNRAHFFAVSAQLMRRILVDHARRHNLKRGAASSTLLWMKRRRSAAIERNSGRASMTPCHTLANIDLRKARVVELRYFGGLSVEETAEVLKVSPITVKRDWSTARAWLHREMRAGARHGG